MTMKARPLSEPKATGREILGIISFRSFLVSIGAVSVWVGRPPLILRRCLKTPGNISSQK